MNNAQLLKGVLDIAVLAVLSKGESYGYAVLAHIRESGLAHVGDASIYGVLRRLEAEGYLQSRLGPSEAGPARRYYALTALGRQQLVASGAAWQEIAAALTVLLAETKEASP